VERLFPVRLKSLLRKRRRTRRISRTKRAKRRAKGVDNQHGALRPPEELCQRNDTRPAHRTPRYAAGGSITVTNATRGRTHVPISTCPRERTKLMKSRKERVKDPGRIEQRHRVRMAVEKAAGAETGRDEEATREDVISHEARESHHRVHQAGRAQMVPRGAGKARRERKEVILREGGAIRKNLDRGRTEKAKERGRK
jgi:hypothetical protein